MPLFQRVFAKDESELAMLEEPSTVLGRPILSLLSFFNYGALQRQSM